MVGNDYIEDSGLGRNGNEREIELLSNLVIPKLTDSKLLSKPGK